MRVQKKILGEEQPSDFYKNLAIEVHAFNNLKRMNDKNQLDQLLVSAHLLSFSNVSELTITNFNLSFS